MAERETDSWAGRGGLYGFADGARIGKSRADGWTLRQSRARRS
jgi:hypothetical protein